MCYFINFELVLFVWDKGFVKNKDIKKYRNLNEKSIDTQHLSVVPRKIHRQTRRRKKHGIFNIFFVILWMQQFECNMINRIEQEIEQGIATTTE